MPNKNFIIVDKDPVSANQLCRALSAKGYAFPVASLEEVGGYWPEEFSIFVSDDDGQLNDVIEFVRENGIFYPIIPYSSNPSAQRVVETIKCGVMSYLNWPCSDERLEEVLDTIGESCEIIYREAMSRAHAFSLLKTLTPREAEILAEISRGASNKEVSTAMKISPRTVEVHRANIFAKLKVKNMIGAVRTSIEARLPTVPVTYR